MFGTPASDTLICTRAEAASEMGARPIVPPMSATYRVRPLAGEYEFGEERVRRLSSRCNRVYRLQLLSKRSRQRNLYHRLGDLRILHDVNSRLEPAAVSLVECRTEPLVLVLRRRAASEQSRVAKWCKVERKEPLVHAHAL